MSLRPNSFFGSVVFALIAAVGLGPVSAFATSLVTDRVALLGYLSLCAASYLALLAEHRSRRLGAVLLTVLVGVALMYFHAGLDVSAMALAFTIGVGRSRIVFPGRLSHPAFVELCIGVAALVAANQVLGYGMASLALAVWTFFLVQGAFFLAAPRDASSASEVDAFDVAASRATELMDDV